MTWETIQTALFVATTLLGILLAVNDFRKRRWTSGWTTLTLVLLLAIVVGFIK